MKLIPSTERLQALKLDRGPDEEHSREWQGDKVLIGQPTIWRLKGTSASALLVQLLCSFMPAHGHEILSSRFAANFQLPGMPSEHCSIIDLYPRNVQEGHPTSDNTVWVMDTETGLKLLTERRLRNFLLQIEGIEILPKIVAGGKGTGRGVWDFISLPGTSVQGCKVCYLILRLSTPVDSLKINLGASATIETSLGLLPFTLKKNRVEDTEYILDLGVLPEIGQPPAPSKRETASPLGGRTKVFISYSHKDKRWLERLRVHLKPLEREGLIDLWDDTQIDKGAKWAEEIMQAVNAARVALLLISPDFLASDFIVENELPPLLAAAESAGARILPVIVSDSLFSTREELSRFQAVNDPSKPLERMTKGEQDEVFKNVAESIFTNQ